MKKIEKGIVYQDINKKKYICGEIIKGNQEGKWTYWCDRFWNSDEFGKESEGAYKDREKEGKWVYWYGKGEKRMEATYRAGKIKGGFIQWYKNGKKKLEVDCDGEIDDNMLDYTAVDKESRVREWNEDGTLKSIKTFKNGKIIDIKGKRYIFGKIKNGKKYGKWKIVDEKLSYVEGLYKEGNWEGWYDNGNKWKNINYKDGKLDGKYLIWYENGGIKCDGVYKNEEIFIKK